MPLMPLGLDIYVKSLQLKASKHRVSPSTNSNEASDVSEAKLEELEALNVKPTVGFTLPWAGVTPGTLVRKNAKREMSRTTFSLSGSSGAVPHEILSTPAP